MAVELKTVIRDTFSGKRRPDAQSYMSALNKNAKDHEMARFFLTRIRNPALLFFASYKKHRNLKSVNKVYPIDYGMPNLFCVCVKTKLKCPILSKIEMSYF